MPNFLDLHTVVQQRDDLRGKVRLFKEVGGK